MNFHSNKSSKKKLPSNDLCVFKKIKNKHREPIKLIMKRNLKLLEKYNIDFLTVGIYINNDQMAKQFGDLNILDNSFKSIGYGKSLKPKTIKKITESDIKKYDNDTFYGYNNDTFYSYDRNLWFSLSPSDMIGELPTTAPIMNKQKITNILNYPVGTYIYVAKPGEEWNLYILRQSINNYIKKYNNDDTSLCIKFSNWMSKNPIAIENKQKFLSTCDDKIFEKLKKIFSLRRINSITLVKKQVIPVEFIQFLEKSN